MWVRGQAYTGFWWGNLRERDHLGDRGIDGEDNIQMDLQEVGYGVMDWIGLAQDRDRWRALVNAVMIRQIPRNEENLTGSKLFSPSRRTLLQGVFLVLLLRHCHVVGSTLTLIKLLVTKTSDVFVTVNKKIANCLTFCL